MEKSKEYFNLYVEFQNTEFSKEELYNTFAYTVLDAYEINQYIDLIKRKSWGEHAIGNQNLQVVPAHTIKIFDLSKVVHKADVYNRDELLKMVSLIPDTEITLLEQLERYGADVTKEMFGEELEIFLNRLQFEIQLEKRGINAETGELGSSLFEGNIKGQEKSGSSVEAKIKGMVSPLYPKVFDAGIVDNSIPPAFRVEKIASVFASHLKNLKDESGQMIGIFGQWGRGKSYFVDKVFEQFSSDSSVPFLDIKFQAWKYQNTPSIWAYLFELLINEYLNVKWYCKIRRIIKLSVKRKGKWRTWIWTVLGILMSIFILILANFLFKTAEYRIVLNILGWTGTITLTADFVISLLKKIRTPSVNFFNSIAKLPSFKDVLGIQAEIQKELKYLIEVWNLVLNKNKDIKKRILLYVDDLDRCSERDVV